MRFFFYGTLMDAHVRRLVLGRYAPRHAEPATLRGWRRVSVIGKTYPVIVADGRAAVEGILVRGLNAAARRRLEHYEGDLYEVANVEAILADRRRLPALAFVAGSGRSTRTSRGWDLVDWTRRHKRSFVLKLKRRGRAG